MKIHFIAIGGSIMHNLAINLHSNGYSITGSDDVIYDPAKTKLSQLGLYPDQMGWYPERITPSLDGVILGMHAKKDNPELIKAMELRVPIYSFPEFIYNQSKKMKRVVVAGSHGKTTITSMVMHVLKNLGHNFNYMVGAELDGFKTMVNLNPGHPVIILEGDEYLASALKPVPKFLFYHPDIALISGIAWDHINVFPTFPIYKDQFIKFIDTVKDGSTLIFNQEDPILLEMVESSSPVINKKGYKIPDYRIVKGKTVIEFDNQIYELKVFGDHNLMNMEGARSIANELGIDNHSFYSQMTSFTGASKRLEILAQNKTSVLFRDFAHAPSKVMASVKAVRKQFSGRKLIACLELHTYSSLNKEFLPHYRGSMDAADYALIYIDEEAMKIKNVSIGREEIENGFGNGNIQIIQTPEKLMETLSKLIQPGYNILMMSSGNFGNTNLKDLATFVTS